MDSPIFLKVGDKDYAVSFVTPIGAAGVKLYCRRPYASAAPSSFDYPLSTRFDESDTLVVFDDVFGPWEHVFVYRNVELARSFLISVAAALWPVRFAAGKNF